MPTEEDWGNIPDDVKEDYSGLWYEVARLHAYADNFMQLYGDKEAVELLNRCAPGYFALNQKAWNDYIVLMIGKLTDPASSGRDRDNLSFERIIRAIDETAFPGIRAELDTDLEALKTLSEPARLHRNKRIAHIDLGTYHGRHPEPLPTLTISNIGQILSQMQVIMNRIEGYFNNAKVLLERPPLLGDARALLQHLRDAEKHKKERTEMRKRQFGHK